MTKETTTVYKCDICGKEIEYFAESGEAAKRIITALTFKVHSQKHSVVGWMSPDTFCIKDVCKSCNEKLMNLLLKENMLKNAQKIEPIGD